MSNVVKLADSRKMTEAEARGCMDRIALAEVTMKLAEAKLAKKITELKTNHELAMKPQEAAVLLEADRLKDYILGHPDRFKKPRAISTTMGKFGMRLVSNLAVPSNEAEMDQLIARLLDCGYADCVETKHKLVKKALRKRLEAGEQVAGASVSSGEEAFYKVLPAVVKTALADAGLAGDEDGEDDEAE